MTGPRTIALAWLAAAVLASPVAASAASTAPPPEPTIRLAGPAAAVAPGSVALGSVAGGTALSFDVVLAPSHTAALTTLLDELRDPASPRFGHYLTPGEFRREFGPTAATLDAVTGWLRRSGLRDFKVDGFEVRVRATASDAARALDVTFGRFRSPAGRESFAALAGPRVPQAVAGVVTAIVGLTDSPAARPHLDLTPGATPSAARRPGAAATPRADGLTPCAAATAQAGSNFWTPDQVGAMYGVGTLLSKGQSGTGKKIALMELAPHHATDTAAYLTCFGLHNAVQTKLIDGGGTVDSLGTLEANIDIEEAATQAPNATVVSYEGPNTDQGEYDTFNQIVADDTAPAVSTSWGTCEPTESSTLTDALHVLFAQAAAQGQTVVAATGDDGSEDCLRSGLSNPDFLAVDSPANDPLVTGAGGTSLYGPGGTTNEPVWNTGTGAAGGGISQHFHRPSWQPLVTGGTCGLSSCRQVPDVSMNAGVGEVFRSGNAWTAVGGTSIASPKIAAIVADIDTGCTAPVGQLPPKLATFVAQHAYGTVLTDVTVGDNDFTGNHQHHYTAKVGPDLASGVGTPVAPGWSCPQITSLGTTHAVAGTHVTVGGLALSVATIHFGNVAASIVARNATSATVAVPPGSGTVTVKGTDAMGTGTHTVAFTYTSPPAPKPKPNPQSTPGAADAYRMVASDGGIFAFGSAPFYGSTGSIRLNQPIVGMTSDAATGGYWFVARDGGIFGFNAPFFGSTGAIPLAQPVVGMAATPSGKGYWLVDAGGRVYGFGDAHVYGSVSLPTAPIAGIAPTRDGNGYWLAGRDGRVYAFGDAHDYGSLAGTALAQPIVGITADVATGGYWMVASDGGIFGFNAPFFGSTGAIRLNQPIVGIAPVNDGKGYWLVASDGGIFSFGDARFSGSMGGTRLNQPIVGIAAAR